MRWVSIPLLAVASIVPALALTPVPDFSVTRYHGRWYEISAIQGFFGNKCARDVRVEYAPEDGGALIVRNRCQQPDGGLFERQHVVYEQPRRKRHHHFLPATTRTPKPPDRTYPGPHHE